MRSLSSKNMPGECFWWEAMDTDHLEPSLRENLEADVVLVGGGYTSLVAAYFLKQLHPEIELVLLEADFVGFGGSGRNGGMVLHEAHFEHAKKLGSEAVQFTYDQTVGVVDLVEQIAYEAGFDCELERVGYMDVALYPAHLRRMDETREEYSRLGIELRRLGQEEVQAAIHTRRFTGALLFPEAAVLHPGKYVAGLKKAVKQSGVRIFEKTRVTKIREGAAVEALTPGGRVRARKAVFGLNAYMPASRLGVVPDRAVSLLSFIILTEPLSDDLWKELGWAGRQCYVDLRRLHNYVRLTGKRILFGGRVLYHFGVESPRKLEPIYARLHRELVHTFPCLEGVTITHRWCGPVAVTWRRTPIVGRTGKAENLYYALGYTGMGVSLGTLCGRALADLVLGNDQRWNNLVYLRDRMPPLPPEPFRFLGFEGSYLGMQIMDALEAKR
jgi:glycine/D-amino acid oxidase-like deaminating enzyme